MSLRVLIGTQIYSVLIGTQSYVITATKSPPQLLRQVGDSEMVDRVSFDGTVHVHEFFPAHCDSSGNGELPVFGNKLRVVAGLKKFSV